MQYTKTLTTKTGSELYLRNGDAPALPVKVLHKGLCQPIQRQQDCVVLPCDMEFIFICRSERGAFFSAQSEYSRMSAIASGVSTRITFSNDIITPASRPAESRSR